MEVKEAIEFVNLYSGWDLDTRFRRRQVIALLKQGEAYREIYEEIEKDSHIGTWWEDYIRRIKQKYFPKEGK